MIRIPLSDLKQKILATGQISAQELDARIEQKLEQLSGLISKEGAAHIIANELGIKLLEHNGKIKDIFPGMRNVNTNAKVITVYETREFGRADGTVGKVCSALIGDETGSIRLVGWGGLADKVSTLEQGSIINVTNAYARENNNNYKELHLNDNSRIEKNPVGVSIETKGGNGFTAREYTRKTIGALTENDNNVELLCTVRQAFDPRYFEVCPQCNSRIKQTDNGWECPTHKQVDTPDYSYVMNVLVEDGTGDEPIRVVLFREQLEKLTGKNKEQVLAYKESPHLFEDIKHDLLGEQYLMQGKVKKNTFFDRLEFVPNNLRVANAEEELKRLEMQTS